MTLWVNRFNSGTTIEIECGVGPDPYSSVLRLFAIADSANSIKRRIASEREGLSFCCLAQLSILDLNAGERRTARTGSCPVGGRPRFFRITGIDFPRYPYYEKPSR